ncbi:hypothetical protein [Abyssicoccus albus]|uniref:Uncharacterized protein n=1 Tax=Abyssicoccus albus TaxID=1817405 RepID=A0A3N5BBG4_9BACL|nr:hypothetical protein [Abyssicoccus albus]RPF54747.1 hypothetical protein EDD62_1707 [Abyssicoccus albus]
MITLQELKEKEFTAEELMDMMKEVTSYNGTFDNIEPYYMDSFDEIMDGLTPTEIARRMTSEFNIYDDYFIFNGYGNLESLSDYEVDKLMFDNAGDITSEYWELVDNGDIHDYEGYTEE